MFAASTLTRTWCCNECGVVVKLHYDHVAASCPTGCAGTFMHPDTHTCFFDRAMMRHLDVHLKEQAP